MGSEVEGSIGRQIKDPERRIKNLWIDVFLAEQRVAARLHPNLLSPSYTYAVPNLDPKSDPDRADFAVITRAFRDKPSDAAHSIVVGVYLNGRLDEYSTAIDFTDNEGNMDPKVTYAAMKGESGDISTSEILGKFALVTLGRMERELKSRE